MTARNIAYGEEAEEGEPMDLSKPRRQPWYQRRPVRSNLYKDQVMILSWQVAGRRRLGKPQPFEGRSR